MPPEPLPWDRKDFFRDRKHGGHNNDRSEALGPVARWRDSSSSSSSYGGSRNNNNNNDFSPRWGFPSSDFRRPPGHGKQGGWHMYSEGSAHGYPTPRSGDRFLDDDGFRPSGPRGDGRYGRVYRENRTSFGQKEWRSHSWEANYYHSGPPNVPSRPQIMNDQRSVGDSPLRASHPHSDPCVQSRSKDQADISIDANGSGMGQRVDKENSFGPLDWKPIKWSRSGTLTSRGSGFNHSSSSKSMGGESNDVKSDVPSKNVTPVQSPSGDAFPCSPSVAPSEETGSRKKPRLGWGEGLAKYEKKKVEGPEENVNKVGNTVSPSAVEPMNSLPSNLAEKSPRVVAGNSDCSSPTTPSSVACSSSPGLEDKSYRKTPEADGDANNFSVSSMPVSKNQLQGLHFSVEKLELNSIANLSSLLHELLQADDQCSTDSGFVRSSALNKLLLWKGDISKVLELTETEIDSLENELKSLKSDSGSSSPCPASSNILSTALKDKTCEEANMFPRPPPLEVLPSTDMNLEEALPCDNTRGDHAENKLEDIDSPGTATSKFVEPLSAPKLVFPNGWKHSCSGDTGFGESRKFAMPIDVEQTVGTSSQGDNGNVIEDDSVATRIGYPGVSGRSENDICDTILASNKDSATKASEVFVKLLPSFDCCVDAVEANKGSCLPADSTLKEKFLKRKQYLRFKERVLSLKYRAFQHLWKEDLRLLSLRSQRTKPQKKFDLSSRTMQSGNQKHRSSIRSRFASPTGSLSRVPATEIMKFTGKLLSDSQVRIYRNSLKMPSMVLDEKERLLSRFVSSNGLVEDPCAVEKERDLINPWTAQEKEVFMEKLATYGKDFRKISSFLDHKTTADCVAFYYKNHKSECFEKTKKLDRKKQAKPLSSDTYLVTSGKKWSREMNAASLEILGAASVIASQADEPAKLLSGKSSSRKSRGSHGRFESSSSHYVPEDERETAAADVLAGICGSLSSEAMSSCITSSVDPGEQQKVGPASSRRQRPLTPEVTQSVVENDDDTYSDESCGEMDPVDWTDDEKSLFVQALSSYGKDFSMISRCVRTKSRDQCKVFFSKARKCLGLDTVNPSSSTTTCGGNVNGGGGGSDTEDAACVVGPDSVVSSDKSAGSRMDEDLSNVNEVTAVCELNTTMEESCGGLGQLDHEDADNAELEGLPGHHDNGGAPVDVGDDKLDAGDDDDDNPRCEVEVVTQNDEATKAEVEETGGGGVTMDCEAEKGGVGGCEREVNVTLAPIDPGILTNGWCSRQSEIGDDMHHNSGSSGESSSQALKAFQLDLSSVKTEENGLVNHKVGPSFQGGFLRKCSRASSHNNPVAELPLLHKGENGYSGSLKTEKPCGNGDVKLFGKILSKPSSSVVDDDKQDKQPTSSGNKLDYNSFLDLENVPIRSYGFWDGTKIQTGFASLPDSALLLAKYPTAFTNYPIASSKPEPTSVSANANECSVNGACVFSPREFNNGTVVDYPVYSRTDHEVVISNGFEAMSLQQQSNKGGVVKLNGVQGGGEVNGISDPVAALKLHYARSTSTQHQYGGNGGGNGIITREEKWRGQGDVGR